MGFLKKLFGTAAVVGAAAGRQMISTISMIQKPLNLTKMMIPTETQKLQ